ncbi:hypothetical protein [Agromyces seonyuensis]|uniref:Uncharacterized protein n=1 Tax=Agromyces seonyuensis TaxID=2662446 RepID=A0A6I4P185_9MICO|nr:hypothetical protein [Agromyces seonyuensis]MWC00132.1 hypothetical protein [Agromyces seonyuensis]
MNAITRNPADDDDRSDAVLADRPDPVVFFDDQSSAPEPEPDPSETDVLPPVPEAPSATAATGLGDGYGSSPVDASAEPPVYARPRIRWAGILWGLLFAGLATVGIAAALRPEFGTALTTFLFGSVPAVILTAVIGTGVIVLLAGLSGLFFRRARRAR